MISVACGEFNFCYLANFLNYFFMGTRPAVVSLLMVMVGKNVYLRAVDLKIK